MLQWQITSGAFYAQFCILKCPRCQLGTIKWNIPEAKHLMFFLGVENKLFLLPSNIRTKKWIQIFLISVLSAILSHGAYKWTAVKVLNTGHARWRRWGLDHTFTLDLSRRRSLRYWTWPWMGFLASSGPNWTWAGWKKRQYWSHVYLMDSKTSAGSINIKLFASAANKQGVNAPVDPEQSASAPLYWVYSCESQERKCNGVHVLLIRVCVCVHFCEKDGLSSVTDWSAAAQSV